MALAAHVFTTRHWALGAAGIQADDSGWHEVGGAVGVASERLARIHQVHGAHVHVHRRGRHAPSAPLPDADVIVSDDPDVALAVQVADCVPLLLADIDGVAVGAVHAGWRGLAAGALRAAVESLVEQFGCRSHRLVAAVGPSIGACCYEVGPDVRDRFVGAGVPADVLHTWFVQEPRPSAANPPFKNLGDRARSGHWFFDGWAAARAQLVEAGLDPRHIHVAALCTASHPTTACSYRRDGFGAGRLAAAIRRT
jgi:hypothetical protein